MLLAALIPSPAMSVLNDMSVLLFFLLTRTRSAYLLILIPNIHILMRIAFFKGHVLSSLPPTQYLLFVCIFIRLSYESFICDSSTPCFLVLCMVFRGFAEGRCLGVCSLLRFPSCHCLSCHPYHLCLHLSVCSHHCPLLNLCFLLHSTFLPYSSTPIHFPSITSVDSGSFSQSLSSAPS